ncbi:MAG: alkanesulfonate monooxygenase SsuD [Candidatus Latescibacterota bacterium]|jgi:alkanesulfonate monooxygenase SsuD/methylene tetrahydromethanopterin reductase-like flavin-dependent oxidoreductase (luciferase family)
MSHSRHIQFGFCVPIFAMPGGRLFRTPAYERLDARVTLDLGVTADRLGFDSLWVADHLFHGRDDAILEGWTTLAALAGATSQAKLGMIHMAHFLRHASVTAKMTATLDQLSGGRLIHFVDGGNRAEEFHRYGLPWAEPVETRIEHLVEALQLTKALWTQDGPVDYEGRFHQLRGATCTPKPVQRPHPPIWLGEPNPAMLDAVAHHAQGWNSVPVSVGEMERRLGALRVACVQAGRDYEEIEKSIEMQILVAPDLDGVRRKLRAMLALDPPTEEDLEMTTFLSGATDTPPEALTRMTLVGTPEQVSDQIKRYVDIGVTHFLWWFLDAPDEAGMRLFIDEVAPRWR